jgi:hypothetical protein
MVGSEQRATLRDVSDAANVAETALVKPVLDQA